MRRLQVGLVIDRTRQGEEINTKKNKKIVFVWLLRLFLFKIFCVFVFFCFFVDIYDTAAGQMPLQWLWIGLNGLVQNKNHPNRTIHGRSQLHSFAKCIFPKLKYVFLMRFFI